MEPVKDGVLKQSTTSQSPLPISITPTNTTNSTIYTMSDYKFEGWMGLDAKAADGNMVWQSYEPKTFQETDIDVWHLLNLLMACG